MKALLTRIRDGLSETPRGVIAAVIYYMVLIIQKVGLKDAGRHPMRRANPETVPFSDISQILRTSVREDAPFI